MVGWEQVSHLVHVCGLPWPITSKYFGYNLKTIFSALNLICVYTLKGYVLVI